jgi:ribosomal protein L29
MNTQELQNLNAEELEARVVELRTEYFELKEAVRLGKESNTSRLKSLRREIARTRTRQKSQS